MAMPPMTPDQRAANLAKAKAAQAERARLKVSLKAGTVTLAEVLANEGKSEVIAKTKVSAVIAALPGMGGARTAHLMERLGITGTRRVGSLPQRQRAALEAALAPAIA